MIVCLLVVKNDDEFYSYVDCQGLKYPQASSIYSPSERNPNFHHYRESQANLIWQQHLDCV